MKTPVTLNQPAKPKVDSQQLAGALVVFLGAVCFSSKAVIVKLAYQYAIDSVSLLALRMLFSLPFFILIAFFSRKKEVPAIPVSAKSYALLAFYGLMGYYLASLFDFMGLQYITAGLERLILFIYPTLVVVFSRAYESDTFGNKIRWNYRSHYGH